LPQGDEFQINSYTNGIQVLPSVAVTGTNQFVVVWESNGQDGSNLGVFGRRYDRGIAGGEFQINSYTTGISAGALRRGNG
jgi:hypothetical protein